MSLVLNEDTAAAIRSHAVAGYPYEVCGLLLGSFQSDDVRVVGEIFPLENERVDSRENRYAVSGRSMLAAERHASAVGLDVVGYYHSHPNAPARPSAFDLDHATWPGISYPIVSVLDGRFADLQSWVLDDDRTGFAKEATQIVSTVGE